MNYDLINGMFELVGAAFTWRNAYQLYRDQEIKGVYWPTWIFFTLWGLWNLFYYPALEQPLSFYGGLVLVAGNVLWCLQALALAVWKSEDAIADALEYELDLEDDDGKTDSDWRSVAIDAGKKIMALSDELNAARAKLREWGITERPPITIACGPLNRVVYTEPGSILRLSHTDKLGHKTLMGESEIDRRIRVDRWAMYSFEDALGFKHAYAAAFGQSSDGDTQIDYTVRR